ncbi:MAG: hypothetical protein GTN71_16180, partial [Anaerolineae bacterium]|nr:hypothetical protein [Anaerolineae bacterium]
VPGRRLSTKWKTLIPEGYRNRDTLSSVLINATLKCALPPVSLPQREYMERAREIWEELRLPPLKPKMPWYGYSLGNWPKELAEEAELAIRGQHYLTGEKVVRERKSV